MSDLERAEKLLAKGDHEKALAVLIAAWRKTPYPRLGDAIETLDAQLGGSPPVFADGSMIAQRAQRVRTLVKQSRDPRFVRALLDAVRDQPFTSNGSRGFWSTVFSALDTLDDPRVIASLALSQKGWTIRPIQREWLDIQVRGLLARYAERWPKGPPAPPAADKKILDRIDRTLASQKKTGGGTAAALLAAIYEDPEDDGARAVYADHLTESGDPRGEFITLQLQPEPTTAQKKRIRALLDKHERAWIGPLEPVIAKEEVTFRRGFLAGCKVKLRNEMDVRKHGSDPSWATVERLRFGGTRFSFQPFSAQDWGAWHVGPEMKSVRDVNILDAGSLDTLLDAKRPWKIERLVTRSWYSLGKKALDRLARTDRMPSLCAIEMHAPPRGWLKKSFFGKNLCELVLELGTDGGAAVGSWVRELGALPKLTHVTILSSRSRSAFPRWSFTRDAKGALSIATLTAGERRFDDAIAEVGALPADLLTELTITGGKAVAKYVDARARTAMRAAADAQTRLEKLEIDL